MYICGLKIGELTLTPQFRLHSQPAAPFGPLLVLFPQSLNWDYLAKGRIASLPQLHFNKHY